MSEMPVNTASNPYTMDEAEISRRRDLRESHLIFSIDPKGCEDVDDTLSIRYIVVRYEISTGLHNILNTYDLRNEI